MVKLDVDHCRNCHQKELQAWVVAEKKELICVPCKGTLTASFSSRWSFSTYHIPLLS